MMLAVFCLRKALSRPFGTGRGSHTLPSTACWATLSRPFVTQGDECGLVVTDDCFALLTFLHNASVERLRGPDIVRIELGERADLLCRDVYRRLQHKPRDPLGARGSR
jgi:hypothetical protein